MSDHRKLRRTTRRQPRDEHAAPGAVQSGQIDRRRFLATAGGAIGVVSGLYGGAILTRAATAAQLSGPPVKIGSSVPLTGFASGDGEDMMRGFKLALEEMNGLGGIRGRPVEHVALDAGEFAPDVLVNNFKRLITEHKVDVILG